MSDRLRRNLLWALAIAGLIVALTALEFWLQGTPVGVPLATNVLIFALVNVNVILLMALAILIFRNLTKLFFERRRRVVGARLRARLAVAFVGLASLPALLLFLVSLKLITTSVQGWFDARVEDSLRLAADLAADAPRSIERTALGQAQRLAEEIVRLDLTGPGRREIRARHLRGRVQELGLAAVGYYGGTGEPLLSVGSPALQGSAPQLPAERLLDARAGRSGLHTAAGADGDTVQAYWPVREGPAQAVRGVVTASLFVPADQRARLAAAATTYENYRQVRLFHRPIRLSYTLTLATIALLITFSATWFAFYLSRVITTPIQQLAEGTRRVAGGDLDFEIAVQAQDEIGLLVESFNRMTRDLKSNKLELERAYAELQRFALELERRRNLIATILESIGTGVIAIDPRGAIAACNRAAQELLGLSPGVEGHEFDAVFRAPALRPLRDVVETPAAPEGAPGEGRVVVAAGGQLRTLVVTTVPLRDPRFTDLGRLVVVEDLTQLVKAQRVAAWREAARRIAHEIKNPLTPIQLSIERARKKLIDRAPDREQVFLEAAATVISQVEAMKRLVDEFSRFARLPTLRPEPVDVHAVIESALGLYRTSRRGVEFAARLHGAPLVVDGDAEQLRRVFINLLENALDAIEGPGRIEISTAPGEDGRTARILVSDTGRGLPAEDRDRLFLPYVSTKKEGGGLGLAIVSDIVAGHGGTVRAEDNRPHGTVFVLEFPLHREGAAPLAEAVVRHAG
jgi:two-component system, NtrC family, nitrogen regulation sensor histidine kinase NtrY